MSEAASVTVSLSLIAPISMEINRLRRCSTCSLTGKRINCRSQRQAFGVGWVGLNRGETAHGLGSENAGGRTEGLKNWRARPDMSRAQHFD